jgi:hypothetical protein
LWSPTNRGGWTHKDDTLKSRLEPCHRIILNHPVIGADSRPLYLPLRHPGPRAVHDGIEVHAKDSNRGVVSRSEIDVLLNPKTKVARLGKIAPVELVLLHLETALEDLLSFGSANRDVRGDLLVAPDAELADGVAGLGRDRCLTGQLFEDFGGSRQTVTRLSNGYVCGNSP